MRLLLRRAARGLGRQPVWITVALVLGVVIADTGILVGPRFNLTGALAVGPLLACARCNGRLTALAAGLALALCALVAEVTGTVSAVGEGYHFGAVIVAGGLAVLIAVIRTRREDALIKISERVQHAILRPLPAEIGGMAFASHYQSATSAALVGGDLYDIAPEEFAPPLGLNPHPARQDIGLKPGDRLLFYTDGLVESRDRAGRFFGLDDRVAAALALPDLGAAVKRVVRLLLEHTRGGLADDVLLVLGEPRPGGPPDVI
jgi:Stage II sporulation protein E (SpoIIE)